MTKEKILPITEPYNKSCSAKSLELLLPEKPLTERQQEVLELLRLGYSNEQIASKLIIAEETARNHVTRIKRIFKVGSRYQFLIPCTNEETNGYRCDSLLTQREKEVLYMLTSGMSCEESAEWLDTSAGTVKGYRESIRAKTLDRLSFENLDTLSPDYSIGQLYRAALEPTFSSSDKK